MMVDQLCQTEPIDNEKIEILNRLLSEYEQRKSRKTRKPAPNNGNRCTTPILRTNFC